MQPPLRIAVLETDTPLPAVNKKYGGYGDVFEVLLKAGAKASGRVDPEKGLQITKYHVVDDQEKVDDYPNLDDIDAILITGSKHDSFADAPWILKLVDFTRKLLLQDRVRIIGVCFGHQIVGRALGARVGRNDRGWEAAVNDFQLSPEGKRLFKKDTLSIHQMHRDMIFYCPEGVQKLGSSPVCDVQGLYAPRRLITIQGHPEFNEEIMREIIESRHKIGVFDEAAYNKYIQTVGLKHDGVLVSSTFLQFLLDE